MEFRAESHLAFLARLHAEAVGMAWLAILDRTPSPAKLVRLGGHVQSVYVMPGHRRQGIGSALVHHVIDVSHERDLAWLLVHPSVSSISFYRALGFAASASHMALRKR